MVDLQQTVPESSIAVWGCKLRPQNRPPFPIAMGVWRVVRAVNAALGSWRAVTGASPLGI